MRKPFIAGNWKMYKTRASALETVRDLLRRLGPEPPAEVAVCPPFTALAAVAEALEGSPVRLGAQNVHWAAEGAFTGEVAVPMLLECGCRYVILGHSERRQHFHESEEVVRRKLDRVLESDLEPILCVGERLEERESDRVEEVVLGQLGSALGGLTPRQVSRIIVAYEPVWAIGTGRTATPEIAQEVHGMIRESIRRDFPGGTADQVRILYGGSVKPDNIGALMARKDVDGALVGGASLEAESFARIVAGSV